MTIVHLPDEKRYELMESGKVIGHVDYVESGPSVHDYVHTEIDPAYRNGGLAADLVRFALQDARARGIKVRPSCMYVRAFFRRYPDFADVRA